MERIPRSKNDQADQAQKAAFMILTIGAFRGILFVRLIYFGGLIPSIVSRITLIQKLPDLILDIGVLVQKASMRSSWIGVGRIIMFVLLFVLFPEFCYICPIVKLREHSLSHFGIQLRFGR